MFAIIIIINYVIAGTDQGSSPVRGQTPSSMGESFFLFCTRHVSMYLRRGIVIHSFFLSVPRGMYGVPCMMLRTLFLTAQLQGPLPPQREGPKISNSKSCPE
jgi:hypothetical protein